MTFEKSDLYPLFELTPNATPDELREAYLKTKSIFAPSNTAMNSVYTDLERAQILKKLEEAYETLSQSTSMNSHPPHTPHPQSLPPLKVDTSGPTEVSNRIQTMNAEKIWNGECIQNARLALGLSLEEVSKRTKIKKTYLIAIETEDFANLPAPVYVRGFISQIAKTLLLPSEKVTHAYFERYKEKIGSPSN